MGLTSYARQNLSQHLLGVSAYTMPTVYIGLHTADPGTAGSFAAEASGGGYARQAATLVWDGGLTVVKNSAAEQFDNMVGATYTHISVSDAVTAGNMLMSAALTASITPATGESIQFPVGTITFPFT